MHQYRWENQKKHRYYTADLHIDLLGDWVLLLAWGRKGSHLGGISQKIFLSEDEGLREISLLQQRRKQRGYEICTSFFEQKGKKYLTIDTGISII